MNRKRGFYEKYLKRIIDILCSVFALIFFGWLYLIVAVLVRINMGKPIVFKQPRPGVIDPKTGEEHIFNMYKFRTMTEQYDSDGNLLSDEIRLNKFGKALRDSSLDEILEVFNILKGDMSIIGPRPQLVRDMVFMSDTQRLRHVVKPGMSGLAQVMGRNAITWEDKINWDLKYIEKITFLGDLRILLLTVKKVFGKTESLDELAIMPDYGDVLLQEGRITREEYDKLQLEAKLIIEKTIGKS